MPGRKKKFILVDPSFDGKGGDKWQYAMAFLDSANRQNFDFIILANKKSPLVAEVLGKEIDQRNIFDYGFYMHGEIAARHYASPRRRSLKAGDLSTNRKIEAINSKIAEARDHGDHVGIARWTEKKSELTAARLQSRASEELEIECEEPLARPFNRDDFAIALGRELSSMDLTKGDVLFLHTATQAMMESLSELSLYVPETLDIDAYFLFHFGSQAPDARTFLDRYHSYSNFNTLGLRLKTGCPFKRTYLLATSPQLREELEGQMGLPVGIFDGLTNRERYIAELGGDADYNSTRQKIYGDSRNKKLTIGARVADLDDARLQSINDAIVILKNHGFTATVNLAYHDGNRAKAVQYSTKIDKSLISLVYTNENDEYIKFLAKSTIVILPYRADIYKKRVSAVLHDCAVLGISCVVPSGTPLEDGRDYADVYIYSDIDQIAGTTLRAALSLSENPDRAEAHVGKAIEMFSSDVIERLTGSMRNPSFVITGRRRVATVVMPLWGRVGSSYAIEAQIRFLMERGYFVVQVFALDKPTDHVDAIHFFWRMLYENSLKMRANIQRIAYRTTDIDLASIPENFNGFDVYLENIGSNQLWDDRVEQLTKTSEVTVVNHVFNSRLSRRIGSGKFILETHDIQSRQMVHWPIKNPHSFEPESYERLLGKELKEVEPYDYIINVSSYEHEQLSIVNNKSRVITPHIPPNQKPQQYESIGAMSHNHGWDEKFREIYKFDFLLLGDSHPANLESSIWFMEHVFLPHLSGRSHSLGIVGRVCSNLKDRFGDLENVFYCGFVDDIADVRALSKIVVLPDQRGSGISIKTLETLAYGSPFVGTSVAFRGVSDLISPPPPVVDTPREFAEALRHLAANNLESTKLGEAAWEIYMRLSEQSVFDKAWSEVMEEIGIVQ